jgi:hypothetical protein
MTVFRAVRSRGVHYLDTPLGPPLHKPTPLLEPGRVMGASWEPPGSAPPASAGPRNMSQACGRRAEGSFPGLGPAEWASVHRLLDAGFDAEPVGHFRRGHGL